MDGKAIICGHEISTMLKKRNNNNNNKNSLRVNKQTCETMKIVIFSVKNNYGTVNKLVKHLKKWNSNLI